jgi:putative peptide maturation system protein
MVNDTELHLLADSVELLKCFADDGLTPTEARRRLRALEGTHPHTQMDLLWREEPYDGSVHYDLLLDLTGGGTASLSYSPDRALPWPLRGIQRWSEKALVRVNDRVLMMDEAIPLLDFIWDEAPVMKRMVYSCIIKEELARRPVELEDGELQRAMDEFRRERKLFSAGETRRWMERHGMTHEKLERLVADSTLIGKLRDRITEGRVEPYFEEHRCDLDAVTVARIDFSGTEDAMTALAMIREGSIGFYTLAERHLSSSVMPAASRSLEIIAAIRRGQIPADFTDAIFMAKPGEVVGPFRLGATTAILRILSVDPARLDEPTRDLVKHFLFEQWLEKRRGESVVDWCWGSTELTSKFGRGGSHG